MFKTTILKCLNHIFLPILTQVKLTKIPFFHMLYARISIETVRLSKSIRAKR